MVSVYHILQDHVIKDSCDFLCRNPSWISVWSVSYLTALLNLPYWGNFRIKKPGIPIYNSKVLDVACKKKQNQKKKSVKPGTKSARLLKILSLNYWFENISKHIYASTKFNYHYHYHLCVSTIKCFLNSEILGLLYIRFAKTTIKEFCIFITIAWLCKPLDQLQISHSFWFLDKENNDYLSWVTYYLHSKLIYISLRNQGSAHN